MEGQFDQFPTSGKKRSRTRSPDRASKRLVHTGTTCSLQDFQYEPLSSGGNYIRLLEIESAPWDAAIVCRISAHQLEEGPLEDERLEDWKMKDGRLQYAALSYTWGSPNRQRHILLNGCRFAVTANCHYALQQLRHYQQRPSSWMFRYIWVDAICMNQQNLSERSEQVQLMGAIFRKADYVLASLGPHENGSEQLFAALKVWRLLVTYQPISPVSTAMDEAYTSFVERDYWHRVWIVQEVLLAEQMFLMCGQDTLDLSDLVAHHIKQFGKPGGTFPILEEVLGDGKPLADRSERSDRFTVERLHKMRTFTQLIEARFQGAFNLQFQYFDILMDMMGPRKCLDPRDRVFGALSLVDHSLDIEHITPDYHKSALDLAVRCLRFFTRSEAEDLLNDVRQLVRNLIASDDPAILSYLTKSEKRKPHHSLYEPPRSVYGWKAQFEVRPQLYGTIRRDDMGRFKFTLWTDEVSPSELEADSPLAGEGIDRRSPQQPGATRNHTYHTIWSGGRVSGVTDTEMQDGDRLVTLGGNPTYRPCLLLRFDQGDFYRVVGQADMDPRFLPSTGDADLVEGYQRSSYFRLYLDREDAMVLVLREMHKCRIAKLTSGVCLAEGVQAVPGKVRSSFAGRLRSSRPFRRSASRLSTGFAKDDTTGIPRARDIVPGGRRPPR